MRNSQTFELYLVGPDSSCGPAGLEVWAGLGRALSSRSHVDEPFAHRHSGKRNRRNGCRHRASNGTKASVFSPVSCATRQRRAVREDSNSGLDRAVAAGMLSGLASKPRAPHRLRYVATSISTSCVCFRLDRISSPRLMPSVWAAYSSASFSAGRNRTPTNAQRCRRFEEPIASPIVAASYYIDALVM